MKVPGHRVAVKPKDIVKKTDWGLNIVHENEDRERASVVEGTVMAVGPDAWKTMYISGYISEPWAKVGDEVLYAKYVGFDVTNPDTQERWRIVNDEDIVCVLKESKEVVSNKENL